MFNHYRTSGFILKKNDRGEANRIFTVYTKDFGKLDLLARAERKITSKLRGGLELFYFSEIEFIQGKHYKTLIDAVLIDSFKSLKKDLKTLSVLSKISEVFDSLVREADPDEKIWNLLMEVFKKLNSTRPEIVYYYFFWNFITTLGYRPELYNCSLCQKKLSPKDIYFNDKEAGLTCGRCENPTESAKSINPDAIKIIRIILKKDWLTLKKLKIKKEELGSLKDISQYYLSEISRRAGYVSSP
ncbi:MAG: DNA repair protein RecO [Candidatus Nealsonbacteria bacterium]|nr:DNA repair protein RecO [Candidatus Nealsonbacteria bacterium]